MKWGANICDYIHSKKLELRGGWKKEEVGEGEVGEGGAGKGGVNGEWKERGEKWR